MVGGSFVNDFLRRSVREAVIAPELEALASGEGYYAAIVAGMRERTEFVDSPRAQLLVPLTSFMVRSTIAVLNHPEVSPLLPKEIIQRAGHAGLEVCQVIQRAFEAGAVAEFHRKSQIGAAGFDLHDEFQALVPFGESVFSNLAWISGGVQLALRREKRLETTADVTSASGGLYVFGAMSDRALELVQADLGRPYIHPDYIELDNVVTSRGRSVAAELTAEAKSNLHAALRTGSCPALQVSDPASSGRIFHTEWANVAQVVAPADATAELPIVVRGRS